MNYYRENVAWSVIIAVLFLATAVCTTNKLLKISDNSVLAYKAIKNGNLDQAIILYTANIELDPVNANQYAARASCYFSKGLFDQAIADYSQAVKYAKRPYGLVSNYLGRSKCWYKKGDYDRALADVKSALSQDIRSLKPIVQNRLKHNVYLQRSKVYEKQSGHGCQ